MSNPKLYQIDSSGNLREWRVFVKGDSYYAVFGLVGGKLITSEPVICEGKNIGRSNETSPAEQAKAEALSLWRKKQEREGYITDKKGIRLNPPPEPMLAKEFEEKRIKGEKYVYTQPKSDGVRCLSKRDALWSRKGSPFVGVPHIANALKKVFSKHNITLDGELYNHDLHDDFNQIISCVRKAKPSASDLEVSRKLIQYHVYDIQSSTENFSVRCKIIKDVLRNVDSDIVKIVPTKKIVATLENVDQEHANRVSDGYEGVMVRLDGKYEFKRSFNLLKYKAFQDAEFRILDVVPGVGKASRLAAVVVCELPNGKTFGATTTGSEESRVLLLASRKIIVGKKATVKFFQYTTDGVPRFPNFIAVRNYE